MSKFYRTVVTVEVLHDRELGDMDLSDIAREIVEGDFSGKTTFGDPEEVSPERVSELLIEQGSDPAFLLGYGED
jgi:hypothetical protein